MFMVANAAGQPRTILKHVLADSLPEDSLQDSWNVQECIAHYLAPMQADGGEVPETPVEVVHMQPPPVVVSEAPAASPGQSTLGSLQTSLLRPRHGLANSMPNLSDHNAPYRGRARTGSDQFEPPKPIQRF